MRYNSGAEGLSWGGGKMKMFPVCLLCFYVIHNKRSCGRVEMECDGTRAETRFGLPAKRMSPFISAGVSVQSAAGSRGVHISGSNAG